jgi:hypothetical protein
MSDSAIRPGHCLSPAVASAKPREQPARTGINLLKAATTPCGE